MWEVVCVEVAPSGAKRIWFENDEGDEAFLIVWPDGTTTGPIVNGVRRESLALKKALLQSYRRAWCWGLKDEDGNVVWPPEPSYHSS